MYKSRSSLHWSTYTLAIKHRLPFPLTAVEVRDEKTDSDDKCREKLSRVSNGGGAVVVVAANLVFTLFIY